MARGNRHQGAERATHLPWDKEGALPIPAGAPKPRRAGPGAPSSGDVPPPATARRRPPAREEYPGPQTASTGDHVEPGRVRPYRARGR